ncbi:MAG: hypothetical protein CL521_00295 [Actinobacteria bacterium]|nr:hypothetical protein [Actinomycetota bacterium]|tara:strand:- start:29 stop:622 length:594 start_codon:yes stop_codon:yes gene_type:complete
MRIRNHTNPFNYSTRLSPLDLTDIFGNLPQRLCLEIGFGRGVFLRRFPEIFPNEHLLAVELRPKMVSDFIDRHVIPDGVHVMQGNGEIICEDGIADGALDRLFVFHPDPWLKGRHQKRRVINPGFVDILTRKLSSSGQLYLSTDVASLWEDMSDILTSRGFVCDADPLFWKEKYESFWNAFSERDQRSLFSGTWSLT